MDSAALPSLTPLLDGIDRWAELLPLLPVLVSLELVLSADNAIALAAITRGLNNIEKQRNALNIGIVIALLLRIALILLAQWILMFWQLKFLAAIYLLGLFVNKVRENIYSHLNENSQFNQQNKDVSFIRIVLLLAFTDLAFSIDSVAAAVAISDQFLLVITGAVIGVVALRFTSSLFIRWLEIYPRLEMAGYIAVAVVGVKLLWTIAIPTMNIPQWLFLIIVISLFLWGFSTRKQNSVIS